MCVIINPLFVLEDGTAVSCSKEQIDAMNRSYEDKENDFWKRFPDISIDDIDFLSHWHEFVCCETEEEIQEVLRRVDEEKRNAEEYHKNKKTSFWQKLFGH